LKNNNNLDREARTANSTYKKLAFKRSAETFVSYGKLVVRNYIRADKRQLHVAANR
jgi:hypothetical protein